MTASIDASEVARRLEAVRARIEAVADGRDVAVVAVTKGFDVSAPRAALACGLTVLGENYAQELVAKDEALSVDERAMCDWHFIGRLQRNKVRLLAGRVDVWQSVDRVELLDEIARRAPGAAVMIQVDLSDDPARGGAPPARVGALVGHGRSVGLDVCGLMAVGPPGPPEAARPGFRQVVALAEEFGLPERSIGMSGDLEVAVAEGATMVRIGTGLFGAR